MNVRKPIDYSDMFAALDTLMTAELPQMELYCEIGRLVSNRLEKGAAVAAAGYLCGAYPDASGFSPRNLRRMREFYRAYENIPELLAQAMTIGWTRNVVILEAELTLPERAWYIRAVGQFGWSKLELSKLIKERIHETTTLDDMADLSYSSGNGCDEDRTKEPSGTMLRDLHNAEVQRKLHRQGSYDPHLQGLFSSLTDVAGKANNAVPPGKSSNGPPGRERSDIAEVVNPQPPAQSKEADLYSLCGEIPHLAHNQKKLDLSFLLISEIFSLAGGYNLCRAAV